MIVPGRTIINKVTVHIDYVLPNPLSDDPDYRLVIYRYWERGGWIQKMDKYVSFEMMDKIPMDMRSPQGYKG